MTSRSSPGSQTPAEAVAELRAWLKQADAAQAHRGRHTELEPLTPEMVADTAADYARLLEAVRLLADRYPDGEALAADYDAFAGANVLLRAAAISALNLLDTPWPSFPRLGLSDSFEYEGSGAGFVQVKVSGG